MVHGCSSGVVLTVGRCGLVGGCSNCRGHGGIWGGHFECIRRVVDWTRHLSEQGGTYTVGSLIFGGGCGVLVGVRYVLSSVRGAGVFVGLYGLIECVTGMDIVWCVGQLDPFRTGGSLLNG